MTNLIISHTTMTQRVRSDPPSVRAVLDALSVRKRLTGADVRAASGLPRRTVYQALHILRERGDVQQCRSLRDTRQTYFWLVDFMDGRRLDLTSKNPVESIRLPHFGN